MLARYSAPHTWNRLIFVIRYSRSYSFSIAASFGSRTFGPVVWNEIGMPHSAAASQNGSQSRCQIGFTAVATAKSAPFSPSFATRRISAAAAFGS